MGSRDLGADEAFARAEEMVRVWLAEQGGERIEVEINGLGESESYDLRMVRNGRRERVYHPGDFFSALGRVRKAQFVRGRGAWTWSRLWMDVSDGVLHQECDWVRVPMYSYNLPSLVECKKEMDLFPRDEELLPDWLREGAERWRTELVPVAADEEAERAVREVERARLVDVSRRRAAAEVEAAWGRAVEGLLGGWCAEAAVRDGGRRGARVRGCGAGAGMGRSRAIGGVRSRVRSVRALGVGLQGVLRW